MTPNLSQNKTERIKAFLSLERNVTAASAAVFLLGFGEELWKKFLPKYLEALGASTVVIGFYGTAEGPVTRGTTRPPTASSSRLISGRRLSRLIRTRTRSSVATR